jgi:hypothetical protein
MSLSYLWLELAHGYPLPSASMDPTIASIPTNTPHSNNPSNSTGFYNHVPKTMRECTAMIQQASNGIRASNSSLSAKDAEIVKLKKALNDWKNNVKAIKVQDLRAELDILKSRLDEEGQFLECTKYQNGEGSQGAERLRR